jgi:SAM domain (Sterile alpha motif)
MMNLAVWLRSLGLDGYAAVFRESDIDETVLPTLTAEDLKDLGVKTVGHRRKLLNAIALCAVIRRQAFAFFHHATKPASRSGRAVMPLRA